jgi:hypothetical protein
MINQGEKTMGLAREAVGLTKDLMCTAVNVYREGNIGSPVVENVWQNRDFMVWHWSRAQGGCFHLGGVKVMNRETREYKEFDTTFGAYADTGEVGAHYFLSLCSAVRGSA